MRSAAIVPPAVVAHADWGTDRRKRQLASARLVQGQAGAPARFRILSVAAAPDQDLLAVLRSAALGGQVMIGFDFPIGLPRKYAAAAGVGSFPEFLVRIGSPPWDEFGVVAGDASEISLRRPFYPAAPGGTRREHLAAGLGIDAARLRRRCEGTDAEILFWTLGAKQAGKGALAGWRLLAEARRSEPGLALWPFDGTLPELLDASQRVVAAETYPREYYQYLRPAGARGARWSKRRQSDRLMLVPGLLSWAESLGVSWRRDMIDRVTCGFSAGPSGEDEFDAVVGLLGMIGVLTGAVCSGEPRDDPAVRSTEGWILGRDAGAQVDKSDKVSYLYTDVLDNMITCWKRQPVSGRSTGRAAAPASAGLTPAGTSPPS